MHIYRVCVLLGVYVCYVVSKYVGSYYILIHNTPSLPLMRLLDMIYLMVMLDSYFRSEVTTSWAQIASFKRGLPINI